VFRATDDPQTTSTIGSTTTDSSSSTISGDIGRRRYRTNQFNVLSEYTYTADSLFSVGYTNDILRNEDTGIGGYEDYDRHEGLVGLNYRFNPEWKLLFEGKFVRGLYDPPPQIGGITLLSRDLKEYRANFTLESNVLPHDPLYLGYNYTGLKYDEELQSDSDIHAVTFGWKRELSPRMTFALGGGPTYVRTEGGKDEWQPNGYMKFTNNIEHGQLTLGATAGV
ncbi:MAG: hypothetical protein GY702_04960, partial [Desulfobulbaceae bacterium]|nr:hypothetical protein [Desulfobulbaceae bacterium]